MLEILVEELQKVELQLNIAKCKILSSVPNLRSSFLDINGDFMEILGADKSHKYLGRMLTNSSNNRSSVQFAYRVKCAWMKFHQHKHILIDKNVCMYSRLKLFQSVVTPTILFGLGEVAFTKR